MKTNAHPLFPSLSPDEEAPEVEYIHVTRFSADGPAKWHHRRFAAEELTELSQIAETFGGGVYELIAYAGGGISARRRYRLDGKPRPLNPEEPVGDDEDAGAVPPIVAPPAPPSDLTAQMLQLLIGMMQASATQNSQLIQMLLQQGQAQAQTHIQTMAQLYERSQARDTQIFQLLAESMKGGGGKDAVDALVQGIELGQSINAPEGGDEGIGGVIDIAQQVLAGANAAKQAAGGPPNGSSQPPPPVTP